MDSNTINLMERILKNGLLQIGLFILIYYCISFDIVYAVILFAGYFVITHLIDNKRIGDEVKKFKTMKKE